MSLSEHLHRLTISQDSIVVTSQIFQQHYKKNKQNFQYLINEWFECYQLQTDNMGKLKFLYLANDILQRLACQKDSNFANAIKDKLEFAFKDCFSQPSDKFKEQVNKILQIWNQRSIYPKSVLKEFKGEVNTHKSHKDDFHVIFSYFSCNKQRISFQLLKNQFNTHWLIKILINGLKKEKKSIRKLKTVNYKDHYLNEFKKCLEFQQKYRHNSLIHESDIIMSIDKEHLKMVLELKKIQSKIEELEKLE